MLLERKGGITREYFNSLVSVPEGFLDHLDFTTFCMAPQHTGSPYTPPVRTPPQASMVPPTQLLATESPQSSIAQPTQLSATPSLRILPAPEAHMPMVGYPRVPQQQGQVVLNQAAPPQSAPPAPPPQMQAAPLAQMPVAPPPHALPQMSVAPPPHAPPQMPAVPPLQPAAVPSYQMAMAPSSKVPSPRHAPTNPVQGLSPALQPAPSRSWVVPPHQSTMHLPPQSPTASQSSVKASMNKTTGRSRQMGSQSLIHMGSLPKTINFDGRGSWRGFYLKFMAYADELGWSSIQRKYQMWWCMKDVGSDYFSLLMSRDRDMSFEDLVRRMERRFGADDPLEIAQMEFMLAHQLAEEGII
ncbi:proline-rich protein 36-like [Lytechinus pictus]|uniref:proline-rich protein 36-like n=1 Tax=Lytechinus pictus TaxID=7653 RepID=UPI0030B9E5F8